MVYAHDLKSCLERDVGSTPTLGTSIKLSGILPTNFGVRAFRRSGGGRRGGKSAVFFKKGSRGVV